MGAGRVATVLAAAAALALAVVPRAAAAQSTTGAAVVREGWWSSTAGLPTTVPGDALGVGALAGEADKVAAVDVRLSVPAGARLRRLALHLRESATLGSTLPPAAGGAAMVACAVVTDWAAERNAPLAGVPRYDCGRGRAEGLRSPAGLWEFDLTAVGRRWLDGSLARRGVVLVEAVEPPGTFQVSLDGLTTDRLAIDLDVGPTATASSVTPPAPVAAAPSPAAGAAGPGSGAGRPTLPGGFGGLSPVDPTPAQTPAGGAAGEQPTPPPGVMAPATSAPPVGTAGGRGHLPGATLLLIPLLLAGAVLLGLVLGPSGEPEASGGREGGVGRTLARRPP